MNARKHHAAPVGAVDRRRGKTRVRPVLGVGGVIALLLVTSVVVRLLGGTGAAIAREVGDLTSGDPDSTTLQVQSACTTGPEIDALLLELSDRGERLDARAAALELRARDIAAAQGLIEERMRDLAAAENSLKQLITIAESAAETDVSQLTAVYENMKPKEAAAVFQQMAPDFAAGFLARMRPDAAARILAGLEPATAYSVSAILAGRNVGAPTE